MKKFIISLAFTLMILSPVYGQVTPQAAGRVIHDIDQEDLRMESQMKPILSEVEAFVDRASPFVRIYYGWLRSSSKKYNPKDLEILQKRDLEFLPNVYRELRGAYPQNVGRVSVGRFFIAYDSFSELVENLQRVAELKWASQVIVPESMGEDLKDLLKKADELKGRFYELSLKMLASFEAQRSYFIKEYRALATESNKSP